MFERLAELLKETFGGREESGEDRSRTALAALLVHASRIDGERHPEEDRRLKILLADHFNLDEAAALKLMADGEERDSEAVDLYRFTSVLAEDLDQDGRREVVGMLWEVVLADSRLDDYESNLVWRVAELLGVSTRDRVALRKRVEERLRPA